MNEKEILEKADEKVGENVYRANGDYFTQYQGELVNVREIDDETLKTICEHDAIADESDERQEELTVEEVEHDEENAEPVRGTETRQIVEVEQEGTVGLVEDFKNIKQTYKDFERVKKELLDRFQSLKGLI